MGRKPWPLRRYPSFFKILIGDFSNNLQIPETFLKNFDGNIPQKSLLWSPAMRFWHVNVEKSKNRWYFQKGWEVFLKDNGLEFGDLLVFHYAGNSEFYVELYGKTCCQKRVVTASGKRTKLLNVHREDQNNNTVREQSEDKGNNEMGFKFTEQNLENQSLIVSNDGIRAGQTDNPAKIEVIDLEAEDFVPSEQCRAELNCRSRQGRPPRFRWLRDTIGETLKREVKAIEAAKKYIPNYPSFTSVMRKAYVKNRFLGIPLSFYKSNMSTCKGISNAVLEHSGKSWFVKFHGLAPGARLGAGWGDFVNDNAIKLGDVCVFELVERNDVVMKVSIFRC